MPPTRHAVAMSDAVLPSIAERYDSSVRSASKRCCSSSTWPRHSSPIVAASSAGDVGAERRRERRRLREQVVAGEDRDDVRPARVHRRHAAAGLGFVDHVVVVERSEVDQLDRGAAGDDVGGRGRADAGAGVARAQGEGRAQALAARREQVPGDVAEESVVGAHGVVAGGLRPVRGRGRAARVPRRRSGDTVTGAFAVGVAGAPTAQPSGGPQARDGRE